ncbi:MAG: J domain-containing protein [Sphingomonadaceae bacterium]
MRFVLIAILFGALYFAWRRIGTSSRTMSAAEAARLLEVPQTATAETIIAAHKRLIAKVHPDTGGSAELASRVNQARDILLRALSK